MLLFVNIKSSYDVYIQTDQAVGAGDYHQCMCTDDTENGHLKTTLSMTVQEGSLRISFSLNGVGWIFTTVKQLTPTK